MGLGAVMSSPSSSALVGFAGIREAAVVYNGDLVSHPAITTTLSADHRATDGHAGSSFLKTLTDLLQDPIQLDKG